MAAPVSGLSKAFQPTAFIRELRESRVEFEWESDDGFAVRRDFDLGEASTDAGTKTRREFVVLPRVRLEEDPRQWSCLGQSFWNEEALTGWAKRVAGADTKKPAEPRVLRLERASGDSLTVLVLDVPQPKGSIFGLHTALREAFSAPLKDALAQRSRETVALLLSVQHLEVALQWEIVHAFVYLAETVTWKPAKFGQASSGAKPAKQKKSSPVAVSVSTSLSAEDFADRVVRAEVLAHANVWVRTLADLPANVLNPGTYRELAAALARSAGLQTSFLSTRELEKLGAHGFLSVTRADPASKAGILRLSYRPKKGAGKGASKGAKKSANKADAVAKLVLVGKGICFDTGGYNIKTQGSMFGMHGDMTGSALALSLCIAFAELQVPFEVQAHLALAENLISPTAYKPNEVVTTCDGTSIEVMDTDAEGRMLLSDTLALARREKASLVLDFATLTGAAIRALDKRIAAVFSHDPALAALAVECGARSGERVWSFPIGEDYRKELKSEVADILQCSHGNNSDHIYAATFLSHFIGEETPWLHLDLTPASCKGGLGLVESETTGFGVLWAAEVVRRVFEKV